MRQQRDLRKTEKQILLQSLNSQMEESPGGFALFFFFNKPMLKLDGLKKVNRTWTIASLPSLLLLPLLILYFNTAISGKLVSCPR